MQPRVFVAGVGFDRVSETGALARVAAHLARPTATAERFLLVTPNPEIVFAASRDSAFRQILNAAQLSVADGIGIIWASYFLHHTRRRARDFWWSLALILLAPQKLRQVLPARVTGTDLFPQLLALAARLQKKVFLLGAAPGVADSLKTKFEKQLPGLSVVGTSAGSAAPAAAAELCQQITASCAEILLVAFGAPTQEKWLAANWPKLPTVRLSAGLGGAFDFHAGRVRRAPTVFRQLGLEWLWRLILQPRRMGRIFTATVRFGRLVWHTRHTAEQPK